MDGEKKYFVIQFGDVLFYKFLLSIGLTPSKSKTLSGLKIPHKFFFDFLRGVFDGDGCFYSYWDPRWRSSFMFYTEFVSASQKFADWIQIKLRNQIDVVGHLSSDGRKRSIQLKYAKKESLILLRKMYYSTEVICLSRKRLKIEKALGIVGQQL